MFAMHIFFAFIIDFCEFIDSIGEASVCSKSVMLNVFFAFFINRSNRQVRATHFVRCNVT